MPPTWGGIDPGRGRPLRRATGPSCRDLLFLTGIGFASAEALRLNFVQKAVPAQQLFEAALEIAYLLAAQAPMAVIATRLNTRKSIEEVSLAAVGELIAVQQRLPQS